MKKTEEPLLSTLIKRCGRAIDRDIDRMLKEHDIARSQYRVLYCVAHSDNPPQSKLMEMMDVQASTLTLIVDVLVQKGWLTRVRGSQDRRQKRLSLTSEGEKVFKQIPEPSQKLEKLILKTLSKEEVKSVQIIMKKITDELKLN